MNFMRHNIRLHGLLRGRYALTVCLALMTATHHAADFGEASKRVEENTREGMAWQQKINRLDDEIQQSLLEYRTLLKRNRTLEDYHARLNAMVKNQREEISRKEYDVDNVKQFERDILPLLGRMIRILGTIVRNDVPFLADERNKRIDELESLMSRADLNISEKFRQVLEAYQIESDYGGTIEAYRGSVVAEDGRDKVVDFLRVGRNLLIYLELDGGEAAVWDAATRVWRPVDQRYRRAVHQAMRIARKQAAPDLLVLPLPAARTLESR